MSEPFVGGITIAGFGFAPNGYALCNGQLLPINQNQALFSLLGTMYGGNGTSTFALPNLQGSTPIHRGTNPQSGNSIVLGQTGGEANHTLTSSEMPGHTHQVQGSSGMALASSPVGNVWATTSANAYSANSSNSMSPAAISSVGGGQAHNNLQPYLVINFVIALVGIFPSRN